MTSWLWPVLAAPFIGSFLGVLVARLPEEKPLIWGRSACDDCGHVLTALDLVPIASWLALRGRCRYCGARLGWFYPGVELAALAVALVSVAIDRGLWAWLDCLFGWWLLALGWIDLRRMLLPDVLTLPLIVAGLAAALWSPQDLVARALGAVLGYLSLAGTAFLYRRLRGREGLGGGDPKLFAAAGAWVGASALPSVLFLAASLALATAAVAIAAGHRLRRNSALPFGPFLALTSWLVYLFGPFYF